MAVEVAAAQFAANTTSGTQDLTTSKLEGLTPKGALFSITPATANGTPVNDIVWSMGWTDGTTSQALCWNADHGVGTTDTGSRYVADPLVIANATDQTVEARGEFSSWITNGVRINWPAGEVPASAFLINVLFFAGDISCKVGNTSPNTTQDASVDETGVGFEADILFGMWMISILGGAADDNGGHWRSSFGCAINDGTPTERSWGAQNRNSVLTSDNRSSLNTNYMTRAVANTGASWEIGMDISDFDANGFTVTTRDGTRTDTDLLWFAIKLDANTQFDLFSYDTKSGTTGELANTTPGFEPQALLFGMTMAEANDTISEANTIGGSCGVGWADSAAIMSTSFAGDSGLETTDNQSLVDNSINLPNEDGSAGVEAGIPSGGIFQSTGFTLDYTAVETNAKKWFVLAIEIGETDIDDRQPAYVEGLRIFPFSEDFSAGSNDDPWRVSHWNHDPVSDVG